MSLESTTPLAVYALLVLGIVAGMLGISYLLGERRRHSRNEQPYESGITPTGTAHLHFPVQFYLVAMLFVIFDVEAVYLYAWAVAAPEAGWLGFGEMAIFIGILLVALTYLWRVGALDWGPEYRRQSRRK
jgi:NADH-quinone oxidoreductase subunit A